MPISSDLDRMTATELRLLVAGRHVSPVELTERALQRAEATQLTVNAFSSLMPDIALAAARAAENAIMKGAAAGLLQGLPVSVKDLIPVAGQPWESGSRAMAGTLASWDAACVERLRAAGAIIIGKTTTSEFGGKAVGDSPATGITRNPLDLAKTPGGSSAGAAASVAASVTALAVGTDGGGSLRIPAALTGLVGFKPQFGRVPFWPAAASPTLAHVGALARTVADAALLTAAMAGCDARDPFSIAGPVPDLIDAVIGSVRGLRVAWSPTLGYAEPDSDVVAVARAGVAALAEAGAHIDEVEMVFADPAEIWAAEFYSGVGARLASIPGASRELFDPAVVDAAEQAFRLNARGHRKRLSQRSALHNQAKRFFEAFDILLSPTLPVSSLAVGLNAPLRLADRGPIAWTYYTYPFNVTGQPALSLPAGTGQDGMPVGLQIVGRFMGEETVLRAAAVIERRLVAQL